MSPDPDADLARLRAICLALPGAAEKRSHGQPVFYVEKGRIFAWFMHDHHGIGITAVAVRTTGADEQAMLIEQDDELYFRPAYIASQGYIGVRIDLAETDWDHIGDRVAASWELAAPRRLLEAGGR